MKYIKTYEIRRKFNNYYKEKTDALNTFYEDFENNKSDVVFFGIPKVFKDEYAMLYFYYDGYNTSGYYSPNNYDTKKVMDYIKKNIKNDAINSILKKIEDDSTLYLELDKMLNDKPIRDIRNAKVKYVFFTFFTARKRVPDWIKDSFNYNL